MKLSQAIVVGLELVPSQCCKQFFRWSGKRLVAACALGTACLGAGIDVEQGRKVLDFDAFSLRFGNVLGEVVAHPVTGRYAELGLVVQALNDGKWDREKIAAWLMAIGF